MDLPLRVYGYHGTSAEAADSILNEGFRVLHKDYHWLGDGVYFWQDEPLRAWDWANNKHGSNPAVVTSIIRLENCIDLFDIGYNKILEDLVPLFLKRFEKAMPEQKGKAHRLDRELFNFAVDRITKDFGESVKCIRSVFIEGERLMEGSDIFLLSHVQIAVLDTSVIEKSWQLERST
jgi:hypothetical protein